MNTKLLSLAALCVLSSLANAQTIDETRCRSAASIYSAPSTGQGTASGLSGDLIIICDRYGHVRFCQTVAWCINHQGGPVAGIVANSGGQTSVRLNFAAFGNLAGGTFEVRRNGLLIDRDALI